MDFTPLSKGQKKSGDPETELNRGLRQSWGSARKEVAFKSIIQPVQQTNQEVKTNEKGIRGIEKIQE